MSNLLIRSDYKRDLLKYKMGLINAKKSRGKEFWLNKKRVAKQLVRPINEEIFSRNENISDAEFELLFKINPELAIKLLDKRPVLSFREIYKIIDEETIDNLDAFLFHAIRWDASLSKLLSIVKSGKILAGNYIPGYFNYSDNCNMGEYISLTTYNSDTFYQFIDGNVFLIISPMVPNFRTIYVSFEIWSYIQDREIATTNKFSYAPQEYFTFREIPWSYVRAIGIDSYNLRRKNQENIIKNLMVLIDRENITIPLYDIATNKIIYERSLTR